MTRRSSAPLHRRRRRVAAFLLLFGLLAAIATVLVTRDGSADPALPEAGSAYGAGARDDERDIGLLDALAPILAGDADGAQPRTQRRKARSEAGGLGAALPRAAAQVFLVGFEGREPNAPFFERLRERAWGGVVLERSNYAEPGQLTTLTGEIGVVARAAGRATPLLAAVQPGGGDSAFPNLPPEPQRTSRSARAARHQAQLAGRQLRALGIHMTLAPVADLASAGGHYERRAFGDGPVATTIAVRAALDGYRATRTIAAVGHFPGEGAASQNPAIGPATVGLSLDELRGRDLRPFAAVARSVPVVQMSNALYVAWDGVTPATLLPDAVAELRRLGFKGAVLSADLTATTLATGESIGVTAVAALRAGCDLLWLPGDAAAQEEAYRAVVRAVRSGSLPAKRVTDALRRVAAVRRAFGVK